MEIQHCAGFEGNEVGVFLRAHCKCAQDWD